VLVSSSSSLLVVVVGFFTRCPRRARTSLAPSLRPPLRAWSRRSRFEPPAIERWWVRVSALRATCWRVSSPCRPVR